MNALRALLAAASPRGSEGEGRMHVTVNGQALPVVEIKADEADLYRSIDVTPFVHAGDNDIRVEFEGQGEVSYRVTRQSYLPRIEKLGAEDLALDVSYDRQDLALGESVTAHVQAEYKGPGTRDQVIVKVGVAPGFVPNVDDLESHVRGRKVSRYEINATGVVFYLMGMNAGESRALDFRLTPTLAVAAEAPASTIYAYYTPSVRTEIAPVKFIVH